VPITFEIIPPISWEAQLPPVYCFNFVCHLGDISTGKINF